MKLTSTVLAPRRSTTCGGRFGFTPSSSGHAQKPGSQSFGTVVSDQSGKGPALARNVIEAVQTVQLLNSSPKRNEQLIVPRRADQYAAIRVLFGPQQLDAEPFTPGAARSRSWTPTSDRT